MKGKAQRKTLPSSTQHTNSNDNKSKLKSTIIKEKKLNSSKKSLLDSHPQSSSQDLKLYSCTICDRRYMLSATLNRHMKSHKRPGDYPCSYCPKLFDRPDTLSDHEKIHKGNYRFKCEHCDKKFLTNGSLGGHVQRVHPDSLPYDCPECPKKFARMSFVTAHVTRAHAPKEFHCIPCQKSFRAMMNFKTHLKTARHLKRVESGQEVKSIEEVISNYEEVISNDEEEFKLSTRVKLFICEFCENSYKSKERLKRHAARKGHIDPDESTHFGRHECPVCLESFKTIPQLSRHIEEQQHEP